MDLPADIDSPLRRIADDDLGRSAYAKRVADIIVKWRGDHSAVFAIYGEWGSGKTTFKNFILEQFDSVPEANRPLVVEFNPWEWEGPRQVTEAFFAQLTEQIGRKGSEGAEVSKRLGRYGAYFTLGASIADSAGKILPLFIPGTGPLASLLGQALRQAGEETKTASEATLAEQSLSNLRAELIRSIHELNRVLLVAIDDVDRLTTTETAALFQLLKSNADFPNVVYLVLCDRDVVAKNLDRIVPEQGDKYLDKIVQLGLPLPKAYPEQLRSAWFAGVLAVVQEAGAEKLLDQNRLWNLYDQHAEPLFRTMRDVKRYIANLRTLLPSLVHNGDADVDLVDFVGIEILRLFDSPFYESIYCYRTDLIGITAPSLDKQFAEKLRDNRDVGGPVMGIFGELFPRYGSGRWLRARPRGIAHPRAFDRYFAFAIPADQYSPAEENAVLARRGLPDFINDLKTGRDRARLQYLLELLDGAEPPLDLDARATYIASLGEFADSFSISDGAADRDSYRSQIERLIYASLRGMEVPTRSDLLVGACERSKGVWFVARLSKHFTSGEPDALTEEARTTLVRLARQRVASEGLALRTHPALGELLLWQLEYANAEEARCFAEAMLEDADSLLDLLHTFTGASIINTGKYRKKREGRVAYMSELARLLPIEKVLARLDKMDEELLTSTQRELARAVRDDARRVAETHRLAQEQRKVELPDEITFDDQDEQTD